MTEKDALGLEVRAEEVRLSRKRLVDAHAAFVAAQKEFDQATSDARKAEEEFGLYAWEVNGLGNPRLSLLMRNG